MRFKIRVWLLFFCFVGCLVCSPYISLNVCAATSSTTFEDGTVSQQYSNSWLSTGNHDADFYIIDTPAIGTRSFFVNPTNAVGGTCGYWNYTYGASDVLTNWSVYMNFISMGETLSGKNVDFKFKLNDETVIIHLMFASGTNKWRLYNIGATGNTLIADGASDVLRDANFWNYFSWDMTANDTLSVHWNGTTVENCVPLAVVDEPRMVRLTVTSSVTSGTRNFYLDNHAIIVSEEFTGNLTGDVNISVYNESDPDIAIGNWDVYVTNSVGGVVHSLLNQTNPVIINTSDIGTGERFFQISHADYYPRTYYATIVSGVNYTLDAFLPSVSANLYYVKVINDYAQNLYHAVVTITSNLNGTSHEITSGKTDYYGQFPCYLLPEEDYFINISATGYTSIVQDSLFPDPTSYGISNPIVYVLKVDYLYTNYTLFFTDVDLDVQMISAGYMVLGNITVNYTDSNSSTTNTNTYIYELYNGSSTFLSVTNNATQSFNIKNGSINTSRDHVVVLWFNNTADYSDVSNPVTVYLSASHIYRGNRTRFSIDDRISNLFGPFNPNGVNVGWHSLISICIALVMLCILGPYDTGLGIIGAGLSLGFTDALFQLWFTDTFPVLLITLAPLLVILGILFLWARHQGVEGI